MRPASNGLATTLLLLVPLVAVPFAAAIGLPQLSATPAATTGGPDVRPIDPAGPAQGAANEAEIADRTTAAPEPTADDLFAPLGGSAEAPRETSYEESVSVDPRADDRRARVRSRLAALAAGTREAARRPAEATTSHRDGSRPSPTPLAEAAPAVRDDAFESNAAPTVDAPSRSRPAPLADTDLRRAGDNRDRNAEPFPREVPAGSDEDVAGELTWEGALQRMKELGIEDFALSPGDAERGFHFHCQLCDGGDPGVVHRFEAEAADPLTAVASAIEQVETWLRQTAASVPQISGNPAQKLAASTTDLDNRLARLGRHSEPPTR